MNYRPTVLTLSVWDQRWTTGPLYSHWVCEINDRPTVLTFSVWDQQWTTGRLYSHWVWLPWLPAPRTACASPWGRGWGGSRPRGDGSGRAPPRTGIWETGRPGTTRAPLVETPERSGKQTEREREIIAIGMKEMFYLRLYGVRHMVKDHSDRDSWTVWKNKERKRQRDNCYRASPGLSCHDCMSQAIFRAHMVLSELLLAY